MSETSTLLDTIILKDGKKLTGIIDYVSSKQIYFFDFTHEVNIDYLLLAILWKGYNANIRFSVYCIVEHPETALPRAILIPINNIKSSDKKLSKTKKIKQRKKSIKER